MFIWCRSNIIFSIQNGRRFSGLYRRRCYFPFVDTLVNSQLLQFYLTYPSENITQ